MFTGVPLITIEGGSFTVGSSGGISNLIDKTVDKITDNDIKFAIAMSKAEAEMGEVSAPSVHVQYLILEWPATEKERPQSAVNSRTHVQGKSTFEDRFRHATFADGRTGFRQYEDQR